MKKVKTLLSALFMILASAFITACSCTDPGITQVYETGISIRCTTETVEWSKNEESGDLTIRCYKNDRFTIEYTLSPAGVTTTQVDWEFSDNSGILSSSTFSYSKSATESITFTASNKGESTITFTTKATGKKVNAYVKVSEERSKLPTLDAPTGFEYNPATGTVLWDHVTKVLLNGQLQNATVVDGKAKGLVAYKVTVSEYKYDANGVAYIDPETTFTEEVTSNQYTGLEVGKTYAIRVAAVGNDYDAKTGVDSVDFFFHQIPATSDLSNNNGKISFTAPMFSAKSNIYCDGVEEPITASIMYPSGTPINKMGGNVHTVDYSAFGDKSSYDVKVISYPRDYIDAKGYSEINNIKYYPSVASSALAIKKLSEPEISLENVVSDNITIGGTVFNGVNTSTRLRLLGKDGEGITTVHSAKYQYFVLSRTTNSSDYEYINNIAIDFTGNYSIGSTGVTVYITGDPTVDLIGGTNNTVFVRLVGNSASTICSDWVNFAYHQLGKVYNPSLDEITGTTETGIDGLDIATWSINDNIITILAEGVGCVEFYFVNMETTEPSKMVIVENTAYDITDAGLVPGVYKIYARLVGQFTSDARTLTGVISNNPISYFQVLPAPEDTEISSDGTVKFKTVYAEEGDETSEINRYTITFTKGNTQTVSLEEGADLNESVNGEFIVPISEADASGYRTFSIYDVARVIISKADNKAPLDITTARINEYLESEGSFSYSIVANDNGTGSNVISSPSTAVINFTRVASIQTITLSGSNSLKFASVSNKYVVILESDSGDVYSVETTGEVSGSDVIINLANLQASNVSGNILDYVGDEGQVSFRIYAIGGTGKAGITGRINSIETEITFDCSAIPTSLSMDPNGVLSWLSTTGRENDGSTSDLDASYQISFYVDGTLKTVDTKFTEKSTGTAHSDGENYIYSLDVSDVLAKYEGQIVGIKVLEIVSAKFAGKASDLFYAVKLTTANLTKGVSSAQEPMLLWNAVEYATGYTLSCSQAIFSGDVASISFASGSDLTYQIPTDLNLGEYTFTLVAYGSNTTISGTQSSAPYIITSSSTPTGEDTINNPVVTIVVADGKLQASARSTSVVWKDIAGATYTVSYKLKTASDWTSVATDDILSLDNTAEKYFSFESVSAGDYEIQIIPAVKFVDTGIILKDAGSISELTKLSAVDSTTITTNQGLLQFTYSSEKEVSIQLYTVGDGEPALISTSSYNQTISEGKYIVELYGITSGERNIAIKVVSTGCIDSDLSSAYTINKIEAVKEFAKVGDYLQWQPVAGDGFYATNYEIVLDGNNKQTLKVTLDGTDYICYVLVDDNGSLTGGDTPADASVFDYVDGVFKFKPDAITTPGQYTYKIRATITTTGYINSNTASTTVTKLHNEVSVQVGEAGVIEYGAYTATLNNEPTSVVITIARLKAVTGESGEGYEVDGDYDTYTATIPFSEYVAVVEEKGKYSIDIATLNITGYDAEAVYGTTIQFIGNGGSIIDSEISTTYTFDKLATTTSISSASGALTWSSVTNAEKYSVEILDSSSQVVATFDYTVSAGQDVAIPSTLTNDLNGVSNLTVLEEEEEDLGDGGEGAMALAPATTFTYICDEIYSIRVMARMTGALNSKWSSTFSFKKLKAITNLSISRTDTIEREDGTIVYIGAPALYWENPNTETVNLQVNYFASNGIDIYESVTPFPSSEKQYFELSSNIPAGEYAIRMQALGNTNAVFGLLSSDMSEITTSSQVSYIANNTTPDVTSGKLTWSAIPSAYTYKVKFSNTSGDTYETYKNGTELDLNVGTMSDTLVDRLGNGYWFVKVTAVTDPKLGIVSESEDTTHQDSISVYRPGQLGNYKVKNGMLSWTISFSEINDYMANVTLPEGATLVANELISYIVDMAIKGESVYSETYGAVPMEHFYKVNLNINGVNTTDTPTEAVVLNSDGEVVTDYLNGSMIEFTYDVSIETDFNADSEEVTTTVTNSAGITYNAGYYEIYVNPVGDSTIILDGAKTGTLSAYKLSTPKSWYDSVSIQVPQVDEFGSPVLDGEGNQVYDTITSKNDIANGKALWELSVINSVDDGGTSSLTYHKDYTLRAVTRDSETRNSVSVTVGNLENILDEDGAIVEGGERDPNIYDDYKYSRDIKELFYDDEDNRIALDTVYRLFILANGTVDSTAEGHTGTNYLNSNTYMFSDTMTILTTDTPKVTNSQITWNYSNNSTSSKLKIYGPLNVEDGVLVEDETDDYGNPLSRDHWKTETYTIEELAKLRYLDGVDADEAFEGITPARKAELIAEVNSNLLEYQKKIKVIDLSSQEGSRANQYTLTDNASFGTGGYAIYKQEIGDGRGVVDSPESSVVYAYKLGTTSATRKLNQSVSFSNGSSTTVSVDYWLGQNDTAGMFVWKPVPFANAYKLTLKATNVAGDGEDSTNTETVMDDILVVGQTYYEPESDKELNKAGYKYSLDIVATVVTNAGTSETPNYQTASGYFDSNNVATDTANTFYNPTDATDTKTIITGRYFRLDIPVNIVVNDKGQISWNDGTIYVGTVNNYAISYQFSGTDDTDATNDNTPQIDILDSVLGSISIKVKAIAESDCGYINSSYSTSASVTKIAAPVPRVTEGVFEWSTAGDIQAQQSVTASILTIDGETKALADNSVLSYPYFTDVTLDNQASYSSSADEAIYATGNHTITIMYKGTEGASDDLENAGKQFYLASELKTYYVSKLSAPTLKNVINANANEENRISWTWDDTAVAYRLKFFVADTIHIYTIIKEADDTATIEIINPNVVDVVTIYSQNWTSNDYFETDGSEVRFKLNSLLQNINITDTSDGLQVFAFAQAMGSLQTSTYNGVTGLWETTTMVDPNDSNNTIEIGSTESYRAYLSSSYSDRLVISIPSSPTNGQYNSDTGVLTWSMTNVDDIYTGYNIIINAEYQVNAVSSADKDSWVKSAHKAGSVSSAAANFAAATTNANFDEEYLYYDEIKERQVVYYLPQDSSEYIVYVRDTILVSSYRSGDYTLTPTSYKLTSIASNYKFSLTATAYDSTETSSNSYKSATYEYNVNASFSLFYSGNGSPYLPYAINNETRLNNIRKYADSYYKLISDVYVENDWTIIEDFSGQIDGKGYIIYNLSASSYSDGTATYQSFILNNNGTIKDTKFQINYIATSTAYQYQVAGVVINNKGTLDNVHIVTYHTYNDDDSINSSDVSSISVTTTTNAGIFVGGLVLDNRGTITNSSVVANITALENGSGTSATAVVGGIARKMSGENAVISNSYFGGEYDTDGKRISGTIKANQIGGIVESIEKTSSVSRCYIAEEVEFTVTDKSYTASNGIYRGGRLGGIVGAVMASDVTIDMCYSLASIVIDAGSSGTKAISIGGIIADCPVVSSTNVVVSNCYTVVKYTYATGSTTLGHYAYGICYLIDRVTVEDCYYLVDYTLSNRVSLTDGYGTEVDDITELSSTMVALGYTETASYPTLA